MYTFAQKRHVRNGRSLFDYAACRRSSGSACAALHFRYCPSITWPAFCACATTRRARFAPPSIAWWRHTLPRQLSPPPQRSPPDVSRRSRISAGLSLPSRLLASARCCRIAPPPPLPWKYGPLKNSHKHPIKMINTHILRRFCFISLFISVMDWWSVTMS